MSADTHTIDDPGDITRAPTATLVAQLNDDLDDLMGAGDPTAVERANTAREHVAAARQQPEATARALDALADVRECLPSFSPKRQTALLAQRRLSELHSRLHGDHHARLTDELRSGEIDE